MSEWNDLSPQDKMKLLDRLAGIEPRPCGDWCDNWKFPHRDPACVLSEVFSVRKGELCTNYRIKESKS